MRASLVTAAILRGAAASGCEGAQSALDPAGRDAERMALLFTWMAIGAVVIWASVVGLMFWAPRARMTPEGRTGITVIVSGGVIFPLLVLTLLMTVGLWELPAILTPGPANGVSIDVTGQ